MALGKGRVIGREQIPARALEFNALLRESVTPLFHVAGTCAMGAQSDTSAVVDSQCRVRGISGLRVADASIMPRLPRANTFLPVAMIAERAADLILAGGDA